MNTHLIALATAAKAIILADDTLADDFAQVDLDAALMLMDQVIATGEDFDNLTTKTYLAAGGKVDFNRNQVHYIGRFAFGEAAQAR